MAIDPTLYSLIDLRLAEELCFPADMKRLLDKYEPEFAPLLYSDFKVRYEGSLLKMIFSYSRHDYEVKLRDTGLTMRELFEAIINELLGLRWR